MRIAVNLFSGGEASFDRWWHWRRQEGVVLERSSNRSSRPEMLIRLNVRACRVAQPYLALLHYRPTHTSLFTLTIITYQSRSLMRHMFFSHCYYPYTASLFDLLSSSHSHSMISRHLIYCIRKRCHASMLCENILPSNLKKHTSPLT